MEEIGLNFKNPEYVTSLVYIRSDNIPSLIISLWAEPINDVIRLCPALIEYRWVTLEEAKNFDLIDGIYEELEMLDKKLKTGENQEWGKYY